MPPNCRFEIDDFEQEWEYSRPFDYIHGRELEGFVRDYDKLFSQALENLTPNGYLEIASAEVVATSDDGTHLKAVKFRQLGEYLHEASEKFGKSMKSAPTWKDKMEKAGFANVQERLLKVGVNSSSSGASPGES